MGKGQPKLRCRIDPDVRAAPLPFVGRGAPEGTGQGARTKRELPRQADENAAEEPIEVLNLRTERASESRSRAHSALREQLSSATARASRGRAAWAKGPAFLFAQGHLRRSPRPVRGGVTAVPHPWPSAITFFT